MSDSKEPSLTPRVTRTNSVFPQSNYGLREIRDPRNNKLLGYVDIAGREFSPDGKRTSGLPVSGGYGSYVATIPRGPQQDAANRALNVETAAEQRKRSAEAKAAGIEKHQAEVKAARPLIDSPMTVDGILQRPFGMTMDPSKATVTGGKVTDADGNDISKSALGAVAAQRSRAAAVFSGLNLSAIEPSQKFVMSYGADQTIDPATGEKVIPQVNDNMNSNRRHQEQTTPPPKPTQNLMTIQEGVRWLQQLSVKDPAAYNQMVVKLRNASYLSGKDEDLPLNGWSTTVGQAFAYAAQDLAGASNAGETRTMNEWLDARGKTFADSMAQADVYHPVDRHYTDPAALAATARSAAEQLLGRSLTDAEAARFSAHFKGLEDANYNAIDAAGRAKGSATVTDPNAAGQAEAFVRSPEFNADRSKQLVGTYMDAFKSLMGL